MTQAELERANLEAIASEYRQKGYSVSVRPAAASVPQFLAPFQPDLIATSREDNVVVEIKSSSDLASDAVVALAEAVEAQPGWRLELAVVNLPAAPEVPLNGELVPDEQIDSLLREAHTLSREKRYEAATIMAWAAAEGIFRRLARAEGIESERKSSGTVLKQLYANGVIDPDQYDSFSRAMEFRNAFAHGFKASVAPAEIDQFLHEVEALRSRRAA
ncbi:MAG TPA: hypothetical protein VEK57_16340 [Thermoanaerobaculia bacterium]|nr:hypothetical protein [Thermoanaerobaculia bacterium]